MCHPATNTHTHARACAHTWLQVGRHDEVARREMREALALLEPFRCAGQEAVEESEDADGWTQLRGTKPQGTQQEGVEELTTQARRPQ